MEELKMRIESVKENFDEIREFNNLYYPIPFYNTNEGILFLTIMVMIIPLYYLA